MNQMADENVYCRKKGCGNPDCEEHHIIPKSIGGTDKDGRVYLCEKHHVILHLFLLKIVFMFVSKDKQVECYKAIEEFSKKWIGKE